MKTRVCETVVALCFGCAAIIAQTKIPIAVSPARLSFPKTRVGSQSAPLAVVLTNLTNHPVQLPELLVSGIDFTQTNDCGGELAAGARCTIQITFAPATTGDRLGIIEIVASGSNTPQFVGLDGQTNDQ